MLTSTLRLTAAAALFASMCGCETIAPYAAPASQPAASVRFVLHGAGIYTRGSSYGRESGTCEGQVMGFGQIGGINFVADYTPLGMDFESPLPDKSYIERKIPAGKPYMVTMNVTAFNTTCTVSTSFEPEANAQYQFTLLSALNGCRIVPSKLVKDDKGLVRADMLASARPANCGPVAPF